jgi:hypothetical protein
MAAPVPTPSNVVARGATNPPPAPTASAVPPESSASPQSGATPVPTESPRPSSTPVIRRPHDAPAIYAVSVSPDPAGAGELVSGSVITSSNVASVVATVRGIAAPVPKVGVGRFALSYRLPAVIPFFFHGTYSLVVVARNVDGVSATRQVELTLH